MSKVSFNGNYIAPRAYTFENCTGLTEIKVVGAFNPARDSFEGVAGGDWSASAFYGCSNLTTWDFTECAVVNISAGSMCTQSDNKSPSVTTIKLGSGLTYLNLSNSDLFTNDDFHLEYAGSASIFTSEVTTTHANGQRATLTCITSGGTTLTFNPSDNSWN